MKKETLNKIFNLTELDKHVNNESSCIRLQKIQDHLALHPYHLSDLSSSIKEILNQRIGKFSTRFNGILCGYKNIKLLSELGVIGDDSCFIHIDIEADFFIFKPTPQKRLHGIVNKRSSDHVGCLVHNIFNVSLPRPKNVDNWVGDTLDINSEVELEITYTNFDGKLPYIRGEIISVIHEIKLSVSQEEDCNENSTLKRSKKRKMSKKTLFQDEDDEISTNGNLDNANENHEEALNVSLGDDETEISPKPKKRKKKKE